MKFELQESWCFTIQSRNSCDSLPMTLSVSLQSLQDLLWTVTSSTWPDSHARYHSNHTVRRHKSTMRPGTVTCNRNINNIVWIVTLQSMELFRSNLGALHLHILYEFLEGVIVQRLTPWSYRWRQTHQSTDRL